VLGIVAVILGAVGISRTKKRVATNRGVAIGGLVTGIVGTVIGLILLFVTISVFNTCRDQVGTTSGSAFQNCISNQVGN